MVVEITFDIIRPWDKNKTEKELLRIEDWESLAISLKEIEGGGTIQNYSLVRNVRVLTEWEAARFNSENP